jgi:hypothetical protein
MTIWPPVTVSELQKSSSAARTFLTDTSMGVEPHRTFRRTGGVGHRFLEPIEPGLLLPVGPHRSSRATGLRSLSNWLLPGRRRDQPGWTASTQGAQAVWAVRLPRRKLSIIVPRVIGRETCFPFGLLWAT